VNATKTAPSGATVPAAIRDAEPGSLTAEDDARMAAVGEFAARQVRNVIDMQAITIRELREKNRRLSDENDALRKHIEQMAVLA